MTTVKGILKFIVALVLPVIFSSGCSENISDSQTGTVTVKVTDDPFSIESVESATVTITKIELRKKGDHQGNPFITVFDDTVTTDLFKLRNGLTESLVSAEVPEGEYDLARIFIEQAGLKLKDIPESFGLKVPGGNRSGLKVFISPALVVTGGLTSELLLDFDLSRSFVARGHYSEPAQSNGFIFKPVIRAVNNTTAGRLLGKVTDSLKVKIVNAKVWLVKDSVIATAYSDTLGKYAIIGIPAGTYSAFSVKEGYDTLGFEKVNIVQGNQTILDFLLRKKQ